MKNVKGITLIALVITIIVLLILAGISISMLSGNNSILNRATLAKEETAKSQDEEQEKLKQLEALSNLEGTITSEGVRIPAGFAVSEKDNENTLADGLVIKDSNGNEYVWIEVPKTITKDAETDEEIYNALRDYCNDVISSTGGSQNTSTANYTDTWYNGCGLNETDYNKYKSRMLNSIKDNGGFWIGRYEAGIEGSNKDISLARQSHSDILTSSPKAVSKPDCIPYNWVTCSEAQKLASMAINNKDYTSSLMFGIQWDLVLKYLNANGVERNLLINDSSDWGNYYIEYKLSKEMVHGYKGLVSTSNHTIIIWSAIEGEYTHNAGTEEYIALSTGATARNMSRPCVNRGGSFNGVNISPASYRGTAGISSDWGYLNSRFSCVNLLKQ